MEWQRRPGRESPLARTTVTAQCTLRPVGRAAGSWGTLGMTTLFLLGPEQGGPHPLRPLTRPFLESQPFLPPAHVVGDIPGGVNTAKLYTGMFASNEWRSPRQALLTELWAQPPSPEFPAATARQGPPACPHPHPRACTPRQTPPLPTRSPPPTPQWGAGVSRLICPAPPEQRARRTLRVSAGSRTGRSEWRLPPLSIGN